jgi:hypothetical protein
VAVPLRALRLGALPERFAIVRLPAGHPAPAWAWSGGFASVSATRDETSVVCPERSVPPGTAAQGGWRCFRVEGPLAFNEVGVLASLTAPLAAAGLSIFAISTYDTDYLLVQDGDRPAAVAALRAAGHEVAEEAVG